MICMVEFEAPCEVTILGCNSKHFLHKECFDTWVKHHETKRTTATCPLCRIKIDVPKSKVVTYRGLNTPEIKAEEEVEIKELFTDSQKNTKVTPTDAI